MPQQMNPIPRLPRTRQRNKSCPFCAEDIRFEAIKCRYCGEFLYGDRHESRAKFGPREPGADPDDAGFLFDESPVIFASLSPR